ncbi:MAG TPA: sigma-54 dependent transcriptional regulator [Puia sp.]|uniref:sigma-54-dependent transcriptional regulator n=1 Tax=Puia sp. TaxID=2045100 RepID=UPI002C05C3F5|nr:sigma-54 dependent transcriptional regulator [Puia sp.]HVU97063.1 sigma-54 dependent transcriptional regulator [Puia sp.]
MSIAKVLIVEDENDVRQLLKRVIALEGFTMFEAASCKAALRILETETIDVVLCDVKLPDGDGVELIKQIKALFPRLEIIVLTAYGNIPDSVRAIKNGAFDYLTKADDNERILPLLYRALERIKQEKKAFQLEKQTSEKYATFETIIGNTPRIVEAKVLAQMAAPTEVPVLLLGETGSGKEIFAQAIHSASRRSKKTFLGLNCSAFSSNLLESELFGYKSGAFTGATKDKRGLIEEANGGTLFLDEIGEMPLDLQAKLLRLLETSEFIKVGDTHLQRVDIRIIAATNRNLAQDIRDGKFREDLFYRLNLITIQLPALRDRQADIPLLADYFLRKLTKGAYPHVKGMSESYLSHLLRHDWRGNIRELKNVIERSLILCSGDRLTIENLPLELQYTTLKTKSPSAFDLARVEHEHIQRVLKYTGGNKARAAKLLNIGIATLYRKLEEDKMNEK